MTEYKKITSGTESGVPFVQISGVTHFRTALIFDCGQAFRFEPVPMTEHKTEWCGVAFGRFISVAQDGNTVTIYNSDEDDFYNIWEGYFGLREDYGVYDADIISRSGVKALREAVWTGDGIRILHQESWEAICSFIISQNNNIPRIKSLISALAVRAGKKIDTRGLEAHGATGGEYAFPSPEDVAAIGEKGLRELKMGFRAPYIYGAAVDIRDGVLKTADIMNAKTTAEAAEILLSVRGIGPKVAACVLLFGFGRMDAFPVDIWIRKVIDKYFPGEFSPEALGPYAGLAQQYLFYYERWLRNEK